MNYKQALLASNLGMKVTRPGWKKGDWVTAITEHSEGMVTCTGEDGSSNINLVGEAFTCEDWEIYHEPETTTSDAETGSKT